MNLKTCKCGCNKEVRSVNRFYAPGHNPNTAASTRKQFCSRGHDTHKVGRYDLNGTCLECMRLNYEARIKTVEFKNYRLNGLWQGNGILNPDGSTFTTVNYDRLYQVQQGRCAVCKKHQTEVKKRLGADHDHTTGKIRGLLCDPCNRGLGLFKDNIELLLAAINYLEATKGGTSRGIT